MFLEESFEDITHLTQDNLSKKFTLVLPMGLVDGSIGVFHSCGFLFESYSQVTVLFILVLAHHKPLLTIRHCVDKTI